jgi:hypothetical protein
VITLSGLHCIFRILIMTNRMILFLNADCVINDTQCIYLCTKICVIQSITFLSDGKINLFLPLSYKFYFFQFKEQIYNILINLISLDVIVMQSCYIRPFPPKLYFKLKFILITRKVDWTEIKIMKANCNEVF